MPAFVALLRGVNMAGHKKLATALGETGWGPGHVVTKSMPLTPVIPVKRLAS